MSLTNLPKRTGIFIDEVKYPLKKLFDKKILQYEETGRRLFIFAHKVSG